MFDYQAITKHQDKLAEAILKQMYPNESFTSKKREEKAIKDIKWMLQFIVEGLNVNNKLIVENLIVWFQKLFIGLDIDPSHATLLFQVTRDVLHEEFQHHEIDQFLSGIDVQDLPEMNHLMKDNPYQTQKDQYLNALLESKRQVAFDLILKMLDDGVPITDIYLYVFQEAMRHIGVLWHNGDIQVGREHYATAVTQYIMSNLYSRIFNSKPKTNKLLACAVGSELHEIGIRMVADIFELNGWDTHYLGANLPAKLVVDYAKDQQPNVIALSITMPYHLSALEDTISAIRQEPALNDVKVIVGGMPFVGNEELYKTIGADGYAPDAMEGIRVANELL